MGPSTGRSPLPLCRSGTGVIEISGSDQGWSVKLTRQSTGARRHVFLLCEHVLGLLAATGFFNTVSIGEPLLFGRLSHTGPPPQVGWSTSTIRFGQLRGSG